MPVTARDLDWMAARLLPDIYDINQRIRYDHNTRRLWALHDEIMKIRITEPTFFNGQDRATGDVLDNVVVGPFRTEPDNQGGLRKIPQFVEVSEEIHLTEPVPTPAPVPLPSGATPSSAPPMAGPAPAPTPLPPAPSPVPGSFAEATAAVLKPVQPAPKAATQPASTASKYSALATRRKKLHQFLQDGANAYEARLAGMETQAPTVLAKANSLLDDEQNSMKDLEDSLTEFAGANGGPLQG